MIIGDQKPRLSRGFCSLKFIKPEEINYLIGTTEWLFVKEK